MGWVSVLACPADLMHIITGGTHGIGRACVEHLVRQGKTVVATGRDQAAGEEIAATLPGTTFLSGDAANPDDVKRVVSTALELSGGDWKVWSTMRAWDAGCPFWSAKLPIGIRCWTSMHVARSCLRGMRCRG